MRFFIVDGVKLFEYFWIVFCVNGAKIKEHWAYIEIDESSELKSFGWFLEEEKTIGIVKTDVWLVF